MFCDGCGATVQAGQRFCNNCGKQIVGPVSLAQPRPGPSAGTRSPARSVLAGVFGFQYRRRDRSLHRGEYHLCARARVWRPRGCRSVLAAIAQRDRHSSAGKSCVRIHRWMGSPAARELGKDPGVGLKDLSRCSRISRSEPRWLSTPCGCFYPRIRSESTRHCRGAGGVTKVEACEFRSCGTTSASRCFTVSHLPFKIEVRPT